MEKYIAPQRMPWEEVDPSGQSPYTDLVARSKKRGDAHRILSRAAGRFSVTDEEKRFAVKTLELSSFPY